MTLCKYRPQRTYDAQYIIEQNDANGLVKMLGEKAEQAAANGLASTLCIIGAQIAFETMFAEARQCGEVDKWTDFMALFDKRLAEMEGGE